MRELRVITTQGADTGLEDTVVEAFKASLRGALLRPGDVGYDDTRKIHNGMIDRRPAHRRPVRPRARSAGIRARRGPWHARVCGVRGRPDA